MATMPDWLAALNERLSAVPPDVIEARKREADESVARKAETREKAPPETKGVPEIGFWDLLLGRYGDISSGEKIAKAFTPPGQPIPELPKDIKRGGKVEERLLQSSGKPAPPIARDLAEGVALGDVFYGAGGEETVPAGTAQSVQSAPSAGPTRFTKPLTPAGGSWDTNDPKVKLFLLQTALSALTGGVGQTPMGIIGNALGEGGEAVGRLNKLEQDREVTNREMRLKEEQLDISREGSQLKALRSRNAAASAVKDLDPVAQAYFAQRIKGLNQEDIFNPEVTPSDRFNTIMEETKTLDIKTRLASGKLRAAEFSDQQIASAIKDPAITQRLLSAVRASPTEAALLQKRLDAARGVPSDAKPQGKK